MNIPINHPFHGKRRRFSAAVYPQEERPLPELFHLCQRNRAWIYIQL